MAIGISPTVDFAFKLMLGSPEHTRVTIHFLNAILIDQPKITHVKILNPFLGKDSDEDKFSILDILATDEHGRMLNIEMQTSLQTE
jgi:predicted transposase/invertase (TIGR01784 family)